MPYKSEKWLQNYIDLLNCHILDYSISESNFYLLKLKAKREHYTMNTAMEFSFVFFFQVITKLTILTAVQLIQ